MTGMSIIRVVRIRREMCRSRFLPVLWSVGADERAGWKGGRWRSRMRGAVGMDKEDIEYRRQVVNTYKPDVEKLIRYLPWLEEKSGSNVQETFEGSGIKGSSITFPVYDGTLMNFIREVQRTGLVDRNYPYIYSRHRIRTVKDELAAIERSGIREMDVLKGILSKYVLGGMTKGRLWTEAVYNRVFFNIIRKMKQNIEFWDKPMV